MLTKCTICNRSTHGAALCISDMNVAQGEPEKTCWDASQAMQHRQSHGCHVLLYIVKPEQQGIHTSEWAAQLPRLSEHQHWATHLLNGHSTSLPYKDP